MKSFLVIISVIFYNTLYSQCHAKLITGSFDNTNFVLRCPTYKYSFTSNNNQEQLSILNQNNINLVTDEFLAIEAIISKHVLNKTNKYFLQKLNFYCLEIVKIERDKDFKEKVPTVNLEKCFAKYSIDFYFEPILNVKYCVGFALDQNMQLISTDNFPIGDITPFQETTICDLYDLGTTYLKTPAEDLNLIVYKNNFYWSLIEKPNYQSAKNIVKKLLIEASNLNNYITFNDEVYVDF